MPKLKGKLAESDFQALSDEIKDFYKQTDNGYFLDVEDMEHSDDVQALKNAKQYEVDNNKKLKAQLEELKTQGNRDADAESIAKDYEKRLKQQESRYSGEIEKYKAEIDKRDSYLKQSALEQEAEKLATDLFTAPKLGVPHVKSRLKADLDESGKPVVKVLDVDGNETDKDVTALRKEFVESPDFSAIIKGSNATGSSATQANKSSGAGNESSKPDFSKMSLFEKAEHYANYLETS